MPIYEFYCQDCNIIFNFLSKTHNPSKVPNCPKCNILLKKQISIFSTIGRAKNPDNDTIPDFDEAKMEAALGALASKAENINEDDPKQMANLMREFSKKSGLNLGDGMEEALSRLEAGEDPEQIEKDMGDVLGDDPFSLPGKKTGKKNKRSAPTTDDTLYTI